MSDCLHQFGSDLAWAASGDVLIIAGTNATTQRLLRRLSTPRGGYIWNLLFGAGLPGMVGSPTRIKAVQNAIRAQVFADVGVAPVPAPIITLTNTPDGTYTASILYTDAATGQAVPLTVPLG